MLMTTVEFRFLSMISLLVRPPSLTSASEKLRVGALGFSVVEVVPPPPPRCGGQAAFLVHGQREQHRQGDDGRPANHGQGRDDDVGFVPLFLGRFARRRVLRRVPAVGVITALRLIAGSGMAAGGIGPLFGSLAPEGCRRRPRNTWGPPAGRAG